MGAISSTFGRGSGGVEVTDTSSANAYRYPPKSGNYFSSHFIMGGERFDMSQPESYLFGENADLNFLGGKPIPFPYPPAAGNEPTKTLKSLVNIRKDSLRFVRVPGAEKLKSDDTDETASALYNLEFLLDTDSKCSIKIFFFASEEVSGGQLSYNSKVPALMSETFHYKRGIGQLFQQTSFVIDPSMYPDEEWAYSPDKEELPIVIQCTAEDDESSSHAHMTYAVVERSSLDGGYMIKPLKQKQFVHGMCYLLQEIYGIENKNTESNKSDEEDGDDDVEDSGAECVICMSDMRDTLILPCRHLCLCSTCAESLRYQASSCPICRSPFRALLQIRAMRRKQNVALPQSGDQATEDNPVFQAGVPPGYEAVSLIEALNGPCGLPPPNTMEGIHVPPPSRLIANLDTESHNKRRNKKHGVPVEMVKEVMDKGDKKTPDGNHDDTDVKSGIPDDPQKSPILQKVRGRTSRHRTKADSISLPRSASSDREDGGHEDRMEMVNEMQRPTRKSLSEADIDSHRNLSLDLPPLTISSENLADDEREDTSEGEIEPEPDYEPDGCLDLSGYREVDSDEVEGSFAPPPDYSDVMNQSGLESGAMDTEPDSTELDTDDNSALPMKLHLSTTPHSSTDGSASSHDSSHVLLAQAAGNGID